MPYAIDETHDPNLESWVESANDPETDFPIQNLPYVAIELQDHHHGNEPYCDTGVAIGDHVLPLVPALVEAERQNMRGIADPWKMTNNFGRLSAADHVAIRRALSQLLAKGNPSESVLCDKLLHGQSSRHYFPVHLRSQPDTVGAACLHDYTDFYASVYHATNVGSMFRPDNPLLPNYKWIPVGYHGRASSVVPSGTPIRRPSGQLSPAEDGGAPSFGPCKLLDYELELGVVMGRGNELGSSIPIGEAEDHILGVCLLNDWSARDMQKWEYVPLGPFLAKSFATSVSPYLVTMEALAPFRAPAMLRPEGDPKPLPHLFDEHDQAQGGIDITLEVLLASEQMRDKGMDPIKLSSGSFKDMYWTIAQMVTHHASNGCNMQPGDLLGSGTVSGPTRGSRGCLLELTWDGDPFAKEPKLVPGTERTPIRLPTGEERKFLGDGDEVILRGYCERDGYRRIGLGECRGVIEPAAT